MHVPIYPSLFFLTKKPPIWWLWIMMVPSSLCHGTWTSPGPAMPLLMTAWVNRTGVYIQPQSLALGLKMEQDSSATSLQDYYIVKQESLSIWKLKIKELNSLKIWLNIMRHQVLWEIFELWFLTKPKPENFPELAIQKLEILHRFAGLTKNRELFYVQIKEDKRSGRKYFMSCFPEK